MPMVRQAMGFSDLWVNDFVTIVKAYKVDALILAGHMHGGQVYLPLVGALITPGKAPNRHAFGLIREDGRTMYVGAGIGTSIIPIRINMPPEIAIVTVRGNSSKQTHRR